MNGLPAGPSPERPLKLGLERQRGRGGAPVEQPTRPAAPPTAQSAQAHVAELRRSAAQAPTPIEVPTPTLPIGGGAVRSIAEKFTMNPATGAGSMAIAVPVPPGRSGFGPSLTLSYDSSTGNGPFGVGWNLTVPSISRKTDKGLPRYRDQDESDTFVLSGAEDLVPYLEKNGSWSRVEETTASVTRYRYRPRTEGDHARILRIVDESGPTRNVYWEVTTSDNVTHTYGKSAATRIAHPDHPQLIFRWLLEESRDQRGNVVRYEYKAEDLDNVPVTFPNETQRHEGWSDATANRYLKRIFYGNVAGEANPTTAAHFHFEVVFDYGEHNEAGTALPSRAEGTNWPMRQDPFSSHRSGFEIRTYRLCRRILVFHTFTELQSGASTPVAALELEYDEDPVLSHLTKATHRGYDATEHPSGTWELALPSVELSYSQPDLSSTVQDMDPDTLQSLPHGVDGRLFQWIDLDGEGVPGVLSQQGRGLYYKRNLGQGKLAPPKTLRTKPSTADVGLSARPGQQLRDVTGSGLPDLVDMGGPAKGYHARTLDGDWRAHRPFMTLPQLDWSNPSLRFIDLDGDGFADVLMSENHVYTWYPSLREQGFGPARSAPRWSDERRGPNMVFAEGEQSVFLADMTGDGLVDLVRIRDGRVCYWPNLGYGQFGARVVMSNPPTLDRPNLYDPSRVRMADVDGSGPADILYIRDDGVWLWRNQAGNGFSPPEKVAAFPGHDALSSVDVIDLLGTGTASLVWSTPLQGRPPRLRYVDLHASTKPHLLVEVRNNLGLETKIQYTTGTVQYLEDRAAGIDWLTRVPFPVQIVDRVEHFDHVTKHLFVSTYRYRHGFYDAEEREFRGFAYVEQRDAESVSEELGQGLFPDGIASNGEIPVPPVVIKTWFHTGAWRGGSELAASLEAEWYSDTKVPALHRPRLEADDELGLSLDLTKADLKAFEHPQAFRALRGQMLRREVYAEDGSADEDKPYVVTAQTYLVRPLQPADTSPYAVFQTFTSETLNIHYERGSSPRVGHHVVLDVDALGYTTEAATVAYGAESGDYTAQEANWVVRFEDGVHHLDASLTGGYRHGIGYYGKAHELTYGTSQWSGGALTLLTRSSLSGATAAKLLSHTRQRYWYVGTGGPSDASVALDYGQPDETSILPYASYAMALESSLFDTGELYDGRVTTTEATATTASGGGYIDAANDSNLEPGTSTNDYPDYPAAGLWVSSGTQDYEDNDPANDLFALPTSVFDPFSNEVALGYDDHKLLVETITDDVGNVTTATYDYRTLSPHTVNDVNGNDSVVAVDPLGRVTAMAVQGDTGEGDTLTDPTSKYTYDLDRYQRPETSPPASLVVARIKAEHRETHGSGNNRWLVSYRYLGGGGQEVMAKVLAEDGPAPDLDENGQPQFENGDLKYATAVPRWVGTGRTVVDNKGNPIKQFEPYFSETEEFEDDPVLVEWGVTPLLRYDPLGRLIRTDFPDGTYASVTFDPWKQTTSDQNDTAKSGQEWYDEWSTGTTEQQASASKANDHAATPTVAYFDALGRPIVVRLHNLVPGPDPPGGMVAEYHETKSTLDIQGNLLELEDARAITCMTYTYGMLGQALEVDSTDAGTRWMFDTAMGEPLKAGGERNFTQRLEYDELRRPTHVYMHDGTSEKLVERLYYGEAHSTVVSPATNPNNLRGRLVAHFDQAGVVVSDDYDFKGNPLTQKRQLTESWSTVVDYTAGNADLDTETDPEDALTTTETENLIHDDETFTHTFEYDALNRPTSVTNPDDTEVLPTYNDAGLLETVTAKVRGSTTTTTFVSGIVYDEKGRRESITYDQGDGSTELATTSYTYDPLTFRLTYFKTTRPGTPAKLLQSLAYHYDAVGNIVKTVDSMSEDVYFTTAPSDPADADYTYDAVYRLIEATSREHGSITGVQDDQDDVYNFKPIPHGNNPDEFREYTQTYEYDKVGNLTKMVHAPTGASNWTRNYTYPSTSNRLSSIDINGGTSLTYTHDAHGNITDIPHLDAVNWDYADQMSHVEISSDQDVYFSYDASGRRVRKVWITNSGNLRRERIYLGGFEVWRRYDKVGGNWVLDDERETVHISDDHRRICMIETLTWEGGSAPTTITPRYRFQFDNHLGTACVETDETGAVISYEEYHPYGTSSYRSWKTGVEVSAKRYRYTGKERDEETSLYYHGARYYAPWLGRWMSADPAGTVDGTNLFAYVRGSPVVLSDPSGTQGSYFGNENQTPARPPTPEEQYAEISERWGSSSSSEAAPGPEPSEEAAGATLTESSLDRPPPLPKGEPATGLGIEPLGEGHVSDGSGGAPPNPPSAGLGGGPEGTHDAARQEFDPEEAAAKIGAVVTLWHYYAARAQIAAAWTFQTIFVPQEAWNQPPTEPQGDDDDSLRDQAKRLHRPHLGMSPPGRPSAEEIPVLTERQARTASSTGYYTEWVGDRKTGRAVVRKAPKKYRVDIPAGSVADSAQALGFGRRIPPQRAPFDSHGQAVFFDGRRYISRDVDSHVGGVWKMFDRRGRRLGTYDANLNRIGN